MKAILSISLLMACSCSRPLVVHETVSDTLKVKSTAVYREAEVIGALNTSEIFSNADTSEAWLASDTSLTDMGVLIIDAEPVEIRQPKEFVKTFEVESTNEDSKGNTVSHKEYFTVVSDSGNLTLVKDSSVSVLETIEIHKTDTINEYLTTSSKWAWALGGVAFVGIFVLYVLIKRNKA